MFGRGGVWWGELDRPFVIGHASKNSFSKEPQMAFAPPQRGEPQGVRTRPEFVRGW